MRGYLDAVALHGKVFELVHPVFGIRVQDLNPLGFRNSGSELVHPASLCILFSGSGIQDSGFEIRISGFGIQDSGFGIRTWRCPAR